MKYNQNHRTLSLPLHAPLPFLPSLAPYPLSPNHLLPPKNRINLLKKILFLYLNPPKTCASRRRRDILATLSRRPGAIPTPRGVSSGECISQPRSPRGAPWPPPPGVAAARAGIETHFERGIRNQFFLFFFNSTFFRRVVKPDAVQSGCGSVRLSKTCGSNE